MTKSNLLCSLLVGFALAACRLDAPHLDAEVDVNLSARKEDITLVPAVRKYLREDGHKVYLSLTTSPVRLAKMEGLLAGLDLEYIDEVFLALPAKFRNQTPYPDLPAFFAKHKKLHVLQPGGDWPKEGPTSDLGPIMKLLPAAQWVKEQTGDDEAIVITIDDDIAYAPGVFGQLIKTAVLNDGVAGSRGINLNYWNIDSQRYWPEGSEATKTCAKGFESANCEVIEGFGAVAYKVKFVAVDKLTDYAQRSVACKTSDDLVISYTLASMAVTRTMIHNDYTGIKQLAYGFETDALHRGSGYTDQPSLTDMNAGRYLQCLEDLSRAPHQ